MILNYCNLKKFISLQFGYLALKHIWHQVDKNDWEVLFSNEIAKDLTTLSTDNNVSGTMRYYLKSQTVFSKHIFFTYEYKTHT